ncbi:aldehyde dehydrogenase family protein [Amylibacter sp.]|nr:aldehyde dehydrogenase family protein [Amylibacter sp.]
MPDQSEIQEVNQIIKNARIAQTDFEKNGSQEKYDTAAQAVGWAIMEPSRNKELATLAVLSTGLGNIEDKITKNHRKTLGLLRDISKVKSYGVIDENIDKGIIKIARAIGVIGAVVPSTNPIATPANNIINSLKCGNAIIISPSPKGIAGCERLIHFIHAEFEKCGINKDLVQMIPAPGTKIKTQQMLEETDLVIVTGSQNNVRRAYTSGTPAIGVGAGNVTVIIDETSNLKDAAVKIAASKTFDNATSCSSENSLIIIDEIYDAFIKELSLVGCVTLEKSLQKKITDRLWKKGQLNRDAVAQDAKKLIVALGLESNVPEDTKIIGIETDGIGEGYPLSGEKLSRVISIYRAKDFSDSIIKAEKMLKHYGAGHSIGIHTKVQLRANELAMRLPTCRVIVNQAHCFATGGSFNNGMPFSLSMGCGSWGGNSIDDNLHWKHFLNVTKIVNEIPHNEPLLSDIFDKYWSNAGK